MSEDKVLYSAGDQLTFHGLVNDLQKIRSLQEQVQAAFDQVRASHPALARDPRLSEIDEHTIKMLARYDDLIREYQGKNEKAEQIARYNREMDEHSRILMESREKPWLPFHDGE